MNSVTIKMEVQVFFWYTDFTSFGYIPRSGVVGSHGSLHTSYKKKKKKKKTTNNGKTSHVYEIAELTI
jgi:hypothetical protein